MNANAGGDLPQRSRNVGRPAPEGYCRKCILRLHTVPHNQEGLCVYCQEPLPEAWDHRKDEFIQDVRRYANQGTQGWDIACPLTGGKDSIFALYALTRYVPGSRVLAYTWDHGFHTEQSWKNIEQAVRATKVEHKVWQIGDNRADARRVVVEMHRLFGTPCAICSQMPLAHMKMAVESGTPLTVLATTRVQNGVVVRDGIAKPAGAHPEEVRNYFWKAFLLIAPFLSGVLKKALPDKAERILADIEQPFTKALKDKQPNPLHVMKLGYYFDWNKNEQGVMKHLRDELGFKKPAELMTHTSCELARLRGYREFSGLLHDLRRPYKPQHDIPGQMEFETAEVVRSGAISREQGFRELELHGIVDTPPEDTIAYYTETVGMSRAEFDRLLKRRRLPLKFLLSQVIERIRWFFK